MGPEPQTPETPTMAPPCAVANIDGGKCASSVDIIIESSDGVRFGAHTTYLTTFSGGFPPMEFLDPTKLEVCTLLETSEELALLLQFTHPGPLPDITGIAMDTLGELAEAAEKYVVYSAIQICKLVMKRRVEEGPMLVLCYAMKHGYPDLCEAACLLTASKSLEEIDDEIELDRHFRAWVMWRNGHRKVKERIESIIDSNHGYYCSKTNAVRSALLVSFDAGLKGERTYREWLVGSLNTFPQWKCTECIKKSHHTAHCNSAIPSFLKGLRELLADSEEDPCISTYL